MVNFKYYLQITLLSCLFFCSLAQAQTQLLPQAHALNQSQPQINSAISDSILTPGQLLTLSVSVIYSDNTEIYFAVENVDWQAFNLLNFTEQSPVWKNNYWQKIYLIELIAPGVGDYLLPVIGIDVYKQDEYQLLTSKAIEVRVKSSYVDTAGNYVSKSTKEQQSQQYKSDKNNQFIPVLQSIELAIDEPNKASNFLWLSLLIFLLFSIVIALLVWQRKRWKKRKQRSLINQQKTVLSPVASFKQMMKQFERHYEKNGKCDWQVVQLWLNEYIVADPLTKVLSADETELMACYQSVRYAKFEQDKFNRFCIDCYAYLSDHKNINIEQSIVNQQRFGIEQ